MGDTGSPSPIAAFTRASGQAARKPTAAPKENPAKIKRQVKLMIQPIERGPHVVHFAFTVVMLTVAQAGPAKIET